MGGIPLEKEGKERLDLNPDNGRESGCLLVIIMIMIIIKALIHVLRSRCLDLVPA